MIFYLSAPTPKTESGGKESNKNGFQSNQTSEASPPVVDTGQMSLTTSSDNEDDQKTMEIVQKVFHYISMSIAVLFFIEVRQSEIIDVKQPY